MNIRFCSIALSIIILSFLAIWRGLSIKDSGKTNDDNHNPWVI
jgi:hypothetical protein